MKVTILGHELEFDFFEYESAKRLESALSKVDTAQVAHMFDGGSLAEGIKGYCTTVNTIFADIFGAEVVEALFGGVYDFRASSKALSELTLAKEQIITDTEAEMSELLQGKYSPNRTARRSAKKKR